VPVPKNFIACDRDQQMLMPPDMRQWLPPTHLVWFVIDSVAGIDLSSCYARHRDDGWGRAAYDPAMMVTLLLYAYAIGVRSGREIERRCGDDVAFRVITANRIVDHATICRFRTRHRDALAELFVSVLGLCAEAGIVRPGVVAIDGTKVAANASGTNNLTRKQLEEFARRVFDEAERVDAEEDELYGDRRGDEMPEHLRDPARRLEWIRRRLAEREAANAQRKPAHRRVPRVNTTDPDSASQKTPQGYAQGYNGQLAVTEDQVIVAADLVADNNDVAQLAPMITQATDNLRAVTDEVIGTVVADTGYFSDDNASLDVGADLLVAPVATRNLKVAIATRTEAAEAHAEDVRRWENERDRAAHRAARRAAVMDAYAAGQVARAEAAEALEISIQHVAWLRWHHKKFGHLPQPRVPRPPDAPDARQVMLERFAAPGAMEAYALRARTVEPVIGQIKEARRMRRLLHRGRAACRCEWRLMATAHNLRKLWKKRQSRFVSLIRRSLRFSVSEVAWV
jgi:transposase